MDQTTYMVVAPDHEAVYGPFLSTSTAQAWINDNRDIFVTERKSWKIAEWRLEDMTLA